MTPPGSKRPAQEDLTGREKRMGKIDPKQRKRIVFNASLRYKLVKNRNARRIDTTDSTNNTRGKKNTQHPAFSHLLCLLYKIEWRG